jgi:hypothetical protein
MALREDISMRKQWSFVLAFSLGVSSSALIADEIPTKLPTDLKATQEAKKIVLDVGKEAIPKEGEVEPLLEIPRPPADSERFSFSAEYLLWWMKGDKVAPLSTSGTTGILNAPGTNILFGDTSYGGDLRSGARFDMIYWLSREHNLAFEANFLFLETQVDQIGLSSPGAPLLARPFTNVTTGSQSALVLSSPSTNAGAFSSRFDSKLWGAEGNLRHNFISGVSMSVDGLFGFRYLGLKESLDITGSSFSPLPGPVISSSTDNFKTTSDFYGGQVGASIELRKDKWFVNALPKLAIGGTQQSVNITGITTSTTGNVSSTAPTGFLAADSNIGQYSKEKFTFVPELGVNVGYAFRDCVKGYVGYNIIYWSSVSRPGSTIDLNVGNGQPTFSFNSTDLWMQGITLGMEINF